MKTFSEAANKASKNLLINNFHSNNITFLNWTLSTNQLEEHREKKEIQKSVKWN